MTLRSRLRLVRDVAAREQAEAAFIVQPSDISPALFGLPSWTSLPAGPAPMVTRAQAIQVPAVKRARDLICTTIGGLPMFALDPQNRRQTRSLLTQPEVDRPRSVTITDLVDDLLFYQVAWWKVIARDFTGRALRVERVEPSRVEARDGKLWLDGRLVERHGDLLRFYGPSDPLLVAGARAIRTGLMLEASAQRYAEDPAPQAYFTAAAGAEIPTPDEATQLLDDWAALRRERSTGYVPPSLQYNQATAWSPKDMQLVEARDHIALEVARLTGIDAEYLSVAQTSRTYFNSVDRRQQLQDFTLGGFVSAIQDRLSMDDITPGGWRVRVDFGAFTRSDEASRMATYREAIALGAYGIEEVWRREELPAMANSRTPDPAPADPAAPAFTQANFTADDAGETRVAFASEFRADSGKRTVTGRLIPFGAQTADGRRIRFAPGSVSWARSAVSRIKLDREHDLGQLLGSAVKVSESKDGLDATFKVARTPAGDEALALAEDGALDGLSAVVNITDGMVDPQDEGGTLVTAATLLRATLTAQPAFDDARLTAVAMTHDGGTEMRCSTCGQTHPVGPCPTGPAAFTQQPAAQPPAQPPVPAQAAPAAATPPAAAGTPAPAPVPAGISAEFAAAWSAFIEQQVAAGAAPAPVIDPARTATFTVDEALPYRFDGVRAEHSFAMDLIASLGGGGRGGVPDSEAKNRIERFAVSVANVSTLNPNRQRPDLYVDQIDFTYPIYDAINKGTLTDATPFVVPKFNSSATLVADHTEGSEPAGAGAFTTTSQTITPTALSGKTILNREVWDQGGNPMLDTLLWRQIQRAYYEGLEAYAAAQLAANAASITDINLGIAVVDSALEAAITSQLATLQYIRGGNRMRDFFVQVDLFKALAAAKDTAGRKLFPIINPQNATGESAPFYQAINVGGLVAKPAWALAPTGSVVASSWLFDRDAIALWASAPVRFTMDQIKVATVEIGVWGYKAFALLDATMAREVLYDPV